VKTLPKSKETKSWYILYDEVYPRWASFESEWLELVQIKINYKFFLREQHVAGVEDD
jgi:hypothetical protein